MMISGGRGNGGPYRGRMVATTTAVAMVATTAAEVAGWTSPPIDHLRKHKKAKDAAHNGGRYPHQECAASTRGYCGHVLSEETAASTNGRGGTDRHTEISHNG